MIIAATVEAVNHTSNWRVPTHHITFASHITAVLSVIQEKVNNPRPEDPYEPDIAAVRLKPPVREPKLSDWGCAAQLLKDDRPKFLTIAKDWTKKCVPMVIACVAN